MPSDHTNPDRLPAKDRPDDVRTVSYTRFNMKVTAAVTREDSRFAARCLEVEVASQGQTVDEALDNLKEALELYFEDAESPEVLEPPIISTIEL